MPIHVHGRRRVAALGATALALAGGVALASPAAADGPTTFNATGVITIPGDNDEIDLQPASPYPSTINVTGMVGALTDVDVTLHGVNHRVASDVDVLLVAPGGSNLVVLSDLGAGTGLPFSNVDLTFSDGAPTLQPVAPVVSGTYAPTDTDAGEPGPDDFSPGGGPAPSTTTTFADAFGGLEANGTWSLYVIDDTGFDSGQFAGGWSLTLTTAVATQPGLLAFSAAQYRGTEGDGAIDVTVQRTAGADGEVSALVRTSNGSAVGGTDYTPVSQVVTFADGATTAVVSIPVIDDGDPGTDIDLTVTLSEPTGGAQLGGRTTARVVIENDDGSANPTGIAIPASGPADPYPSNLHISGLGSLVTDVNVTLTGITHASSADLDVLLVGPAGQTVMLLSDVGDVSPTVDVTLTLDDEAATPVTVPLASGTYQPTDNDLDGGGNPAPDAALPAPAPAAPYGTSLDVFDGTDPNGTWQLFVVDDATGDAGRIDGWSLDITTAAIDAGGPYTVAEGGQFDLQATANLPGATFAWDLDNDGHFDDEFGATVTIGAGAMVIYGLGDGPVAATIAVQATNGTVTLTDDATVSVTNVAPSGTLSNNGPVLIGEPVTLTLSDLADPSVADEAAGLDYAIDWDGDGTDDASGTWSTSEADPTITVPATAFSTVGDHTLVVTLTDDDGGATDLSTTVSVGATTPTATFANSGPVAEGSTATVTFSDPVDAAPGATFTYSFDLDDDGTFDIVDATDPSAALPAALTADGPATLTVAGRISNSYGGFSDYTTDVVVTNVAPSGVLSDNSPIPVWGTLRLTLTGIDDASAADLAAGVDYAIDWTGDGLPDVSGRWTAGDSDPQLVVGGAFSTVGDHEVVATLTDRDRGSVDVTATIVVEPTTPTATFTGPGSIAEGGAAAVAFTNPTDPAPDATFTYSFDVDGDGSFDIVDAAAPTALLPAAVTDDGPTTVTITGRVTNQYGGFSDYTTDVVVTNVAPSGTLDNDGPVQLGDPATLTLSGLADPSTADAAAGLEYAIDWDGDGAVDGAGTWRTGDADPTITVPTAELSTIGDHVLVVRLSDKDGGASDLSTTVTIGASRPTATFSGSGPVAEGGIATVTFSDAVDAAPGATFTYSFDLDDDGTFDIVDSTDPSAELPAALTADGPATLSVTGRISNQFGGASDYTTDIVVTAEPPIVTVTAPERVAFGQDLVVTVTVDDASPVDRAAGFELTVDFGDSPVGGGGAGAGGRAPILAPTATLTVGPGVTELSHAYTSDGSYTLSVTVADASGAETTFTQQVTVEPPAATPSPTQTPAQQSSASPGGTGGLAGTGAAPLLLLLVAFLAIGLGIAMYRSSRA